MSKAVLVGFDGSQGALAAVDFAAEEARLRQRPLHIVHSFVTPVAGSLHAPTTTGSADDRHRRQVKTMMSEAVDRATSVAPEIEVNGSVVNSVTDSAALVAGSEEAELIVVGSRGRGGFKGLLLGSTSAQVAGYAACPVIVVRPPRSPAPPATGEIVVGVDGSPNSREVLRFGFTEAKLRRAPLTAVYAWSVPVPFGPNDVIISAIDQDEIEQAHVRSFAETMDGWQDEFPDVVVEHRMRQGTARQVLLDASAGATLLVVGSRGRGGFAGMILGSTSQAMLHHASAPVAVLRNIPE